MSGSCTEYMPASEHSPSKFALKNRLRYLQRHPAALAAAHSFALSFFGPVRGEQTFSAITRPLLRKHIRISSLGTVYRNLNLLADIGEALRIPTPAGGDRFDGRCEPHYHVVCTNCGKVFDLEMDDSYIQKINEDANACFDGIIESHNTLFHGLCADCIKKKNENK